MSDQFKPQVLIPGKSFSVLVKESKPIKKRAQKVADAWKKADGTRMQRSFWCFFSFGAKRKLESQK